MKKLHELLKLPLSAGDIGLEIETEGENLQPIMDDVWCTEDDGSLRGRFPSQRSEYVLRKPVKIRLLDKTLKHLKNFQEEAEIKFSFRCSSHVHINVGDMTHPEFLAYLYLVVLLESPLMSLCGEERKGNRFCLRVTDAEGYMNSLRSLFSNGPSAIRLIHASSVRYSAINIAATAKYGSLEFRGMRGTMDEDILIPWCQTLFRLREVARKFGDPIAVHDDFVNMSNIAFAKKHLGKNAHLFDLENTAKDIDKSFSLAIELPYAYKEYEALPKKPEEGLLDDRKAPKVRFDAIPPEFPPIDPAMRDHIKRDLINRIRGMQPPEGGKMFERVNRDEVAPRRYQNVDNNWIIADEQPIFE